MQPYFVPYAGYFGLFATADVVVMLDTVQFPRRGWVHRNRFALAGGEHDWWTLPLTKPAYDAPISDLQFAPDARPRLEASLARFPLLARAAANADPMLGRCLALGAGSVADYLVELVSDIVGRLGFTPRIVRASGLGIDPALRAQDRIIAIVTQLGATRYVNPSGGRALYDAQAFAAAGTELMFLTPYGASMESILTRLLLEPVATIAVEIVRESVLLP
jgi:hypothetical protein